MIRLVATDLDGTLLRTDKTVTAWTRSVLEAVQERGVPVVPVTARQPKGLAPIAEQCGLTGWAVCVNGALAQHLGTGEVAFEHLIRAEVLASLTEKARQAVPGITFATVRNRGEAFGLEADYRAITGPEDHQPAMVHARTMTLEEIVEKPALKLLARHAEVPALELSQIIKDLEVAGVHPTTSGADFVEMSAAGVTKASALDDLCGMLGLDRGDVVAFGDAPNDVEMLRWAGCSYVMDQAHPKAVAVATGNAGSNDDDGVGRTLMRFLREGII
ncbi:MAG: HAD-IIB family hydrolase [Luteococcus sp.]|uniref:HAD-IIB family hydrolase n=1 Tax=Luteococcus sp. TaxID=1969402 RepID=UPI00264A32B4|nr:HAD-IIB family hydrolase [Luteococcus sp.]MDN5564356.1 HAD-IIB family hydrolase [Luteococcus sp.]